MIGTPLTRASTLAGYADWFREIGAPVDAGLQRALLPLSFRECPEAWVSYRQMRLFVADMAYREGVCDRGVLIADLTRVFNQGMVEPVLQQPDLGNAIRVLTLVCRIQNSGVRCWLEPMGDMVRLCLQLPLPSNFPGHVLSEVRTLELIKKLLRTFAGPVFQPANVLLTSRRRELLFDPGDVFEDLPVYTDQSRSALVFPRSLLFARGKIPGEAPFANADDNATAVSPQLSTLSVLERLLEPYLPGGTRTLSLQPA